MLPFLLLLLHWLTARGLGQSCCCGGSGCMGNGPLLASPSQCMLCCHLSA